MRSTSYLELARRYALLPKIFCVVAFSMRICQVYRGVKLSLSNKFLAQKELDSVIVWFVILAVHVLLMNSYSFAGGRSLQLPKS
jgi:hypothetical protein